MYIKHSHGFFTAYLLPNSCSTWLSTVSSWPAALLASFTIVIFGFGDWNLYAGSNCNIAYSPSYTDVCPACMTAYIAKTWILLLFLWEVIDFCCSFLLRCLRELRHWRPSLREGTSSLRFFAITIVHFLVDTTSISGAVNSPADYVSIYAYWSSWGVGSGGCCDGCLCNWGLKPGSGQRGFISDLFP